MLFGLNKENIKIGARPKGSATCSLCGIELVPKCGLINVWHWAHKTLEECDSWSEGETPWHLGWKKLVKKENCEVVIGNHRADIVNSWGFIIELQNSSIDVETIQKRELFYKKMVWLFNGSDFVENFDFREKKYTDEYNFEKSKLEYYQYKDKSYYTFRWKYPRKTMWYIRNPLFIDLGNEKILQIKKIYQNTPCGGWGYMFSKEEFIKKYLSGVLNEK